MGFTLFDKPPEPDNCRYFLDKDDDAHWYLVKAKYRKEWEEFKSLPSVIAVVPSFAKMLNYNISDMEFSNPLFKKF